jgi:hypothetical protein
LDALDPALPGGGVLALTPDRLSGEDVNKALTHYLKALEAAQSENIRNKVLRDALPTLHFSLENNDQNWCATKEQRYRLFETGARIAGLIQVPCGPQGNDLPLDDALAAWNTVDTVFPAPKPSAENH